MAAAEVCLNNAGAMAVIRYAQKHGTKKHPWLGRLMARRPPKVVRDEQRCIEIGGAAYWASCQLDAE